MIENVARDIRQHDGLLHPREKLKLASTGAQFLRAHVSACAHPLPLPNSILRPSCFSALEWRASLHIFQALLPTQHLSRPEEEEEG